MSLVCFLPYNKTREIPDVGNGQLKNMWSIKLHSNMTSFFRFVKNQAIYRLDIISLVINVHVDELLSARIWQHKTCATLSANVNINYRLAIKVYHRICTLRHIRIEIIHGNQNVFWVLTWVNLITHHWLGIKY